MQQPFTLWTKNMGFTFADNTPSLEICYLIKTKKFQNAGVFWKDGTLNRSTGTYFPK